MGLCCRSELAGVTGYVRLRAVAPTACHRFLRLFHSSGLDLDALAACWVRLRLKLFELLRAGDGLICLADGIKAPRRAARCPPSNCSASNRPSTPSRNTSWDILSRPSPCWFTAPPAMSPPCPWPRASIKDYHLRPRHAYSARQTGDPVVLHRRARRMQGAAGGRRLLPSGKLIAQLLAQGHQLVTRASRTPSPTDRR